MGVTSRTEVYVVQGFRARGRAWEAIDPARLGGRDAALNLAGRLSEQCLGVAVHAVEVAEDVDYCGEPRLIASFGYVPDASLR